MVTNDWGFVLYGVTNSGSVANSGEKLATIALTFDDITIKQRYIFKISL
jgi:hypothetical protein